MRFRHSFLFFCLAFIIVSCNVQKRRYSTGYYVDWHTAKTKKESTSDFKHTSSPKKQDVESVVVAEVASPANPPLLASGSDVLQVQDLSSKPINLFAPEDSCDVLIFKDGSEVKAKIVEVGINDIKYKRCNNLDGPNHISRKSEIFMIKYANGTKEVIRSESPEPIKTYDAPKPTRNYNYTRSSRRNHPLALPSLLAGSGSIVAAYITLIVVSFTTSAFLLFLIPIALGIAAFAMGKTALSDIKAQPETFKGKGMAIPGMIMGMIMAAICALILFIFLAFA